jgi:hypothetical protein
MTSVTPPELLNRRRSQRVALRVAVFIQSEGADGKRKQIEAFTLIVNAHGGLMETSLLSEVNQNITLVNPKTGSEAKCRVVRVEQRPSEMTLVAFEFHEPTAQFWPIRFPPDDWEALDQVD